MKMVLVTTGNEIKVLDYPTAEAGDYMAELRGFYKTISCDSVECVHPSLLYEIFDDTEGMIMLVDEMGLINGKRINPVASFLYGMHHHGQPIVGDVLFVSTEQTFDGVDWVGIEEKRAEKFAKKMRILSDVLEKRKEEAV